MRIAHVSLFAFVACATPAPPSDELRQLYRADQAERAADWSQLSQEELHAIAARDELRRQRVLDLVRGDQLKAPADRYHAAMVLQHGGDPDDYLLAHVLAAAAAFDGHHEARWLAAAALDRYLHAIDRAQWFDTQYRQGAGKPWTMEPRADRLPDGLRQVYGVPPAAVAAEQLRKMNGDAR